MTTPRHEEYDADSLAAYSLSVQEGGDTLAPDEQAHICAAFSNCLRDLAAAQERIREFEETSGGLTRGHVGLINSLGHANERINTLERDLAVAQLELASVKAALKLANDSCRTAYQVASRKGNETNWEAWQFALQKSLNEQHRVMYPEQYSEDRRIRAHDLAARPKDAP